MLEFYFREIMEGTIVRKGERFDRPFRFEFDVNAPNVLGMLTTAIGEAVGTVRLDGLAKNAAARGTLELSPVYHHRMRYRFEFTGDDGKRYTFDGSKKTTLRRHLVGWTTLPGKVLDEHGDEWGAGVLRFSLPRHLVGLVRSIRIGPEAARRRAAHA